jgi:hypothetical protein
MHIHKEVQEQEGKPTTWAQVSMTKGITRWTLELDNKHIVNETSIQLHNIIRIEHNKGNYFKTWKYAS